MPTLAGNGPDFHALSDILSAARSGTFEFARQDRFEVAAQIVAAVLQLQVSPWLSSEWSSTGIFFQADASTPFKSKQPLVKGNFLSVNHQRRTEDFTCSAFSEEDNRRSLFSLGVVVLELILGSPLGECTFRKDYLAPNGVPNDETDARTARKWAQKVLPECGVEIADVVRRCLDCSFRRRPDLSDRKFRETVFAGVVTPLCNFLGALSTVKSFVSPQLI